MSANRSRAVYIWGITSSDKPPWNNTEDAFQSNVFFSCRWIFTEWKSIKQTTTKFILCMKKLFNYTSHLFCFLYRVRRRQTSEGQIIQSFFLLLLCHLAELQTIYMLDTLRPSLFIYNGSNRIWQHVPWDDKNLSRIKRFCSAIHRHFLWLNV